MVVASQQRETRVAPEPEGPEKQQREQGVQSRLCVVSSSCYQTISSEIPFIWKGTLAPWKSLQTPGRPGTFGARNQMLPLLPLRKAGYTLDAPEPTALMVDTTKERP